jgi:hypothetical protein
MQFLRRAGAMSLFLFLLAALLGFAAVPPVYGGVQCGSELRRVVGIVCYDIKRLLAFLILAQWIDARVKKQFHDT